MKSNPKIGFMQGRLSPKPVDRIQAFPKDSWKQEFEHAQKIGFDCIELIYDDLYFDLNPLCSKKGHQELVELSNKYKVILHSICADYFMVHPLIEAEVKANELIKISHDIGCQIVEFPFVDTSSLIHHKNINELTHVLQRISRLAKNFNIKVALETDLPPKEFKEFLNQFDDNVGANLDLGNSAAQGYNVEEECAEFGSRILNIHIKDRKLKGTTVPLLEGNVDFEKAFYSLGKLKYNGDFILQTAPDPNYLAVAEKYKNIVNEYIKKYMN